MLVLFLCVLFALLVCSTRVPHPPHIEWQDGANACLAPLTPAFLITLAMHVHSVTTEMWQTRCERGRAWETNEIRPMPCARWCEPRGHRDVPMPCAPRLLSLSSTDANVRSQNDAKATKTNKQHYISNIATRTHEKDTTTNTNYNTRSNKATTQTK